MATTAKPGRKRARYRRGKESGRNSPDRFAEATAAPRLLRSLLRAHAGSGAKCRNENSARRIENRAFESDHSTTSATRVRCRFTDSQSDAEKETKRGPREEVSRRGLVLLDHSPSLLRAVKGNLADVVATVILVASKLRWRVR